MKPTQFGILVFLLCIIILGLTPYDDPAGMIFAIIAGLGLIYSVHSWFSENKASWIWVLPKKWYDELKLEDKVEEGK